MWPGWSPLPWLWPLGLKREEVSVALRVGGGKFGKGRERLAGEGSFPAIGCCVSHYKEFPGFLSN